MTNHNSLFTLLAGTTNQHKLAEIRQYLAGLPIPLNSLNDFPAFPEVLENGRTFAANARKKARVYFEYFQIPTFADDSGLIVPALNGEPGVRSARYAGPDATYDQNNRLLMQRIAAIDPKQRKAQFVCTICYKDGEQEALFTGTVNGTILTELRGTAGFGYDPLFYIPELGKTYAEISMDQKNALSHRGKALKKFKMFLENNIL